MNTPATILTRLAALFPHAKKTTLRDMVASKRVRLNGSPVKSLKQPVAPSDKFEVTDLADAPSKPALLAEGLKLVFLDSHIVIIDKPSGLLTATDPSETRPTVLQILTDYFRHQNSKNQIHLVHRLDRDASGLLVFARTAADLHALKSQFLDHAITRRYDALVHGIPAQKSARLENLLLEEPRTGIVHTTTDHKLGKLAILDYVTLQTNPRLNIAHLLCTLHTGRKHQIRVQLRSRNHPVLADPLYGLPPTPQEPPRRLALHASHLSFKHPSTHRKVAFDSQMPNSFAALFRT